MQSLRQINYNIWNIAYNLLTKQQNGFLKGRLTTTTTQSSLQSIMKTKEKNYSDKDLFLSLCWAVSQILQSIAAVNRKGNRFWVLSLVIYLLLPIIILLRIINNLTAIKDLFSSKTFCFGTHRTLFWFNLLDFDEMYGMFLV